MNKVIRSEAEYQSALSQIEELIDQNAAPKTAEGERLDLLTILVREYENNKYGEVEGSTALSQGADESSNL